MRYLNTGLQEAGLTDPTDVFAWQRLDEKITTSGYLTEKQLAEIQVLGVTHVINLALDSHEKALPNEAAIIAALGMTYIHIPVDFNRPTEADFERFCAALAEVDGSAVHVHCIVNARVSAFFYRYNRDVRMIPEHLARNTMEVIWQPGGVWAAFVGHDDAVSLPHRPGRPAT